jgi:MauM/NapG family ferredoxin protein
VVSLTRNPERVRRGLGTRLLRKLVQLGFLGLFLFPLFVVVYKKITFQPAVTFTSWLLPWDPLILISNIFQSQWSVLVIGAPLLLLALTFIFGRSFCGWVCPIGSLLDLVSLLAFWRKKKRKNRSNGLYVPGRNTLTRYYLLIAGVLGGLISLKLIGLLDPLVIFHRVSSGLAANLFALQQPAVQVSLGVFSLIFLTLVFLELWQARFWCRNLCPLGALLSLVSRFSLLNRRVSLGCNHCGECRRICPMNAVPREPHDTIYSDCTFCLECRDACPRQGISFNFGTLAGMRWQPETSEAKKTKLSGKYQPENQSITMSRRQVIGGLAAGVVGLSFTPLTILVPQRDVLRPPGALPEEEFIRTCIICQECVRVCPTGGLHSVFLESGLAGIGTPQLLPRQGACALNPSCPDLCAQVCPVGAILPVKPDQLKLGVARVDHELCLAWDQGARCLVCVEACLAGAAQVFQGRVVVDPQKCTGCGRCECGCPVSGSAIRVFPIDRQS